MQRQKFDPNDLCGQVLGAARLSGFGVLGLVLPLPVLLIPLFCETSPGKYDL